MLLLFFLSLDSTILCDCDIHSCIVLIAESKLISEANTTIAVVPIELDNDLSIVISIIFVNSTIIYGNTNKSTDITLLLLIFCFMCFSLLD